MSSKGYLRPVSLVVGLHLARGAQLSGWRVDRLFPIDSRFVGWGLRSASIAFSFVFFVLLRE
ncbi:hypothetical protein [Phormidesmis priestleyi]